LNDEARKYLNFAVDMIGYREKVREWDRGMEAVVLEVGSWGVPYGKLFKLGKLYKFVRGGKLYKRGNTLAGKAYMELTERELLSVMGKGLGEKGFNTLAELGLKDGMKVTSNSALELGEKFLGKGYNEVVAGSGRYISKDGKRVFRMGVNDITGAHGGGPHVNFETLVPNPAKPGKMKVDTNLHIYLID
jgi:hypothetical protein